MRTRIYTSGKHLHLAGASSAGNSLTAGRPASLAHAGGDDGSAPPQSDAHACTPEARRSEASGVPPARLFLVPIASPNRPLAGPLDLDMASGRGSPSSLRCEIEGHDSFRPATAHIGQEGGPPDSFGAEGCFTFGATELAGHGPSCPPTVVRSERRRVQVRRRRPYLFPWPRGTLPAFLPAAGGTACRGPMGSLAPHRRCRLLPVLRCLDGWSLRLRERRSRWRCASGPSRCTRFPPLTGSASCAGHCG